MKKRVLIVGNKAGDQSMVLADILKTCVTDMAKRSLGNSMEIEVVDGVEVAEKTVRLGGVDTVIFPTGDSIEVARKMKARLLSDKLHTQVVVLAAVIPGEEVLLIGMRWLYQENLLEAIMHST